MNTRSQTFTTETGTTLVLGTITHNGHEYTAGGGSVDLEAGHVYAYATDGNTNGHLTLWNGERIGTWRTTSTWRNARDGSTMRAINATLYADNRQWYGRYGSDWSEIVHLRPRAS
jgi:hypothetical protein